MESCGMNLVKYLLFVFNVLFAISGLGILLTGAFVLTDVGDYKHFMDSGMLAPPVILIIVGIIIFAVAFLGCFGAIRELSSLLIAFAVCLLVIFIVEFAVGITAVIYRNDFGTVLRTSLDTSLKNYETNKNEQAAWDTVQKRVKCCGVTGPSDWSGITPAVPESCRNQESSVLYTEGCYEKLKEKVHANAKVLIGVGIGIAFIQVAGIILAGWLACIIRKENADVKTEG